MVASSRIGAAAGVAVGGDPLLAHAGDKAPALKPTARRIPASRPVEFRVGGHSLKAEPLGPPDSKGRTVYEVSWRGVTVQARLTGQLGAAQFKPGSWLKGALERALRESQAGAAGAAAPAAQGRRSGPPPMLRIDLESPAINERAARNRGMFGTKVFVPYLNPDYTSGQAAAVARELGYPVRQWTEPAPNWHTAPKAHAVVDLPNTSEGGRAYARMNHQGAGYSGNQGTLKLPPGASKAFKEGYQQESRQLALLNLVAIGTTLVGAAGARGVRGGTGGPRPRGPGTAWGVPTRVQPSGRIEVSNGGRLLPPVRLGQRANPGRQAAATPRPLPPAGGAPRSQVIDVPAETVSRTPVARPAAAAPSRPKPLPSASIRRQPEVALRHNPPVVRRAAEWPEAPATPRATRAAAPSTGIPRPSPPGASPARPGTGSTGPLRGATYVPVTPRPQQRPPSMPNRGVTVLDQTTNHYKESFFKALGSTNTSHLPLVQQPPPDELELSTKGNAAAKARHAANTQLPAPILLADIAVARGILPPALGAALQDYMTFGSVDPRQLSGGESDAAARAFDRFIVHNGGRPSTDAWWRFLGQVAQAAGRGAEWEALRAKPVVVLTDDSKTQVFMRSPAGGEQPLSFHRLDKAVRSMRDDPERTGSALLELHRSVRAVAATLQATRAHHAVDHGRTPDAPFRGEDSAFDWYLSQLGGHGLLGPDGAPIGSLMSPLRLLEALDQLARIQGLGGVQDLVVRSKSVVSATLQHDPAPRNDATRTWQATGFADLRLPSLAEVRARFDQGEPVDLDHVLEPVNGDGRAAAQLIHTAAPQDLQALPRGKALEELRDRLDQAGLPLPPVGARPALSPLGRDDLIAVVIPAQADSQTRAALVSRILSAWRSAGGPGSASNMPTVRFHELVSMDDPSVNAEIRGASIRYFVSPELVPGADTPEARRHFALGVLSDAIDATVGPAALRANPSFVVHDPRSTHGTGPRIRGFLEDLYRQGEVPHPLPISFVPSDERSIRQAAEDYWRSTTVRPRTLAIHPRSSPLKAAPDPSEAVLPILNHRVVLGSAAEAQAGHASYRSELPPIQVALFGSAAEQPPPGVVASTHRVMTAFIRAVERRDAAGQAPGRQRLTLRGEELDSVARRVLAVARPVAEGENARLLQKDYLRRVEAALRAMPGVDVRRRLDGPDDPVFEIDVPQVRRPVVPVHGAGRSRHPMRTSDDPVRTVMDGFNLVHPIADREGRIFWVSSRGVTTPELLLLEGTPPPGSPHVLPRPHTQEFARLIVERTALVSSNTQIAFSFAGRMGTRQDELFYKGPLVIIDPDPNSASLRRVVEMRGALGLQTRLLDSNAADLAAQMDEIVSGIDAHNRSSEGGR
jgi:hypothetical protein